MMFSFIAKDDEPTTIPELEPFDEEELDDIFAQLEEGDEQTDE